MRGASSIARPRHNVSQDRPSNCSSTSPLWRRACSRAIPCSMLRSTSVAGVLATTTASFMETWRSTMHSRALSTQSQSAFRTALGITSKLVSHPSVALGASEVTLLELVSCYAAIASGGYATWPHGISEIRDSAGALLFRRTGSGGGKVTSPDHARAIDGMLRGVIANGTGRAAWPGRRAAGKTGTSQDFRDAWFIGYAGDLVTGGWGGNDDFSPMKRITGGGLPARLWRSFMVDALKSKSASRHATP